MKKKKKNYNEGGEVEKLGDVVAGGASMAFPVVGQIAGAAWKAMDLINKLGEANYKPLKYNMNYGGDMPLSEGAMEVNGNPGIDTNPRMVAGDQINLTEGEMVKSTQDGAYVFSNAKDMKHPMVNKTFADVMKPLEKGIGKAEKKIRRAPGDEISKNTIKHVNKVQEVNMSREELERSKKQLEEAQALQEMSTNIRNFYRGGKKNYNDGGFASKVGRSRDKYGTLSLLAQDAVLSQDYANITQGLRGVPAIVPRATSNIMGSNTISRPTLSANKSTALGGSPMMASQMGAAVRGIGQAVGQTMKTAGVASLAMKRAATQASDQLANQNTKDKLPMTAGDKAYLFGKTLETLNTLGIASQSARQYRADRYNIEAPKYSAQPLLDRNQSSYRSAIKGINTGNANTDRILRSQSLAQKMASDRQAIGEYDNMNRQAQLQTRQFNAQQKAQVDQINEQISAIKTQASLAAGRSLSELGRAFQDADNTKITNNITLATLNSLSRRYGLSVDEIKKYITNYDMTPEQLEGVVKYKAKN